MQIAWHYLDFVTYYISAFHCYRLSVQYHDNTQLYANIWLEEFN